MRRSALIVMDHKIQHFDIKTFHQPILGYNIHCHQPCKKYTSYFDRMLAWEHLRMEKPLTFTATQNPHRTDKINLIR